MFLADLVSLLCASSIITICVGSSSSTLGLHPLDENYFESDVIECKDRSKSFTKDRLNDNFCDCPDGTDEPGTAACPAGKFYCRNVGSAPKFIFSSRVNDRICDCCDGSDEYDGSVYCPKSCIMGANVEYKTEIRYTPTVTEAKDISNGVNFQGLPQKLKTGLKIGVILQLGLIGLLVLLRVFKWSRRSRRRRPR